MKRTPMLLPIRPGVLAAALALALACAGFVSSSSPSFAAGGAARAGQPKTYELRLHFDGTVHDTQLPKGTYRIDVAPSLRSITFYRGKEAVLTAPCLVSFRTVPLIGNSVYYAPKKNGRAEITRVLLLDPALEIDLAGAAPDPIVAGLKDGRAEEPAGPKDAE